jgi:hypothetical protein
MQYEITKGKDLFANIKRELDRYVIPQSLEDYCNYLEAEVVKQIRDMGISVDGDLIKSVTHEVKQVLTRWTGTVGPNIRYALWVHEGTKPHWAPIKPLVEWVRKKGIVGRYNTKTRKRLGGKAKTASEDMSAARAIQRSIAKRGTRGKPFLRIVARRETPRAANEIAKRIARHVKLRMRDGLI